MSSHSDNSFPLIHMCAPVLYPRSHSRARTVREALDHASGSGFLPPTPESMPHAEVPAIPKPPFRGALPVMPISSAAAVAWGVWDGPPVPLLMLLSLSGPTLLGEGQVATDLLQSLPLHVSSIARAHFSLFFFWRELVSVC